MEPVALGMALMFGVTICGCLMGIMLVLKLLRHRVDLVAIVNTRQELTRGN